MNLHLHETLSEYGALRFVESDERFSVYMDRDDNEVYLAHGTARAMVPFYDLDLLQEWRDWINETGDRYNVEAFRKYLRGLTVDQIEVNCLNFCTDCQVPDAYDDFCSTAHGSVCEGCSNEYFLCNDCDQLFAETSTTLHDTEVCDGCRGRNWSWCDECDGYFRDVDSGDHGHDDEDEDEDYGDDGCCESPALSFAIRNDGKGMLANDQETVVTLPKGEISEVGMLAIAQLLQSKADESREAYNRDELTYDEYALIYNKWWRLSVGLPETVGTKWQATGGNFTKRLSRHAHQQYDLKVPPEVISQVGNIASAHSGAVDHVVTVTRDVNGSASEFGHSGSCWWSCYSESRCALKSNGGFGLRSFENGYVSGRCWVLPLRLDKSQSEAGELKPTFDAEGADAFVVFNGYDSLNEYKGPRILAHMVGMTYRKIRFTCSPMFINGESGYLVAPEEIAEPYTDGRLGLELQQHSRLYSTEIRAQEDAAAAIIEEPVHV